MAEQVGPPRRVAGYLVDAPIAEGAMATVYRARRVDGGAPLALKLLRGELARSPEHRRRFVREARYMRELRHPHIVQVYDAGTADNALYIAMQYVEGGDLRTLLAREGPLAALRATVLLKQVADALDAAHGAGVLHRDVKPGNVLVASGEGPEAREHCYLTDFGLGKNPRRDSVAATAQGQFVGTWHYTAPELIAGREFDHRVDVYSLGCVLFECLTGGPPFAERRGTDVLQAHLEAERPGITDVRPGLPVELEGIVAKALERDPSARWESCGALIDAVAAVVGVGGSSALRLGVIAGGERGREVRVEHELVIGRGEVGAGALGGDVELSRRHALIRRAADGSFRIEDLGSTNGTEVNGRRITEPTVLAVDDRVELGSTMLVVVGVPSPALGAADPAAGKLRFQLELDAARGEARVVVAGQAETPRLLLEDGRWRLAAD